MKPQILIEYNISDYTKAQIVEGRIKRFNSFHKVGILHFKFYYTPVCYLETRDSLFKEWHDFPLLEQLWKMIDFAYWNILKQAFEEFHTKFKGIIELKEIVKLALNERELVDNKGCDIYWFLRTTNPYNINFSKVFSNLIVESSNCATLDDIMYVRPENAPIGLRNDGKLIMTNKNLKYKPAFRLMLECSTNIARNRYIEFLKSPAPEPQEIFPPDIIEKLIAFHTMFDDKLWKSIDRNEFLNTFRTNTENRIELKKGNIRYFNYALHLIERKRINGKYGPVGDFAAWYKEKFHRTYRTSLTPKKTTIEKWTSTEEEQNKGRIPANEKLMKSIEAIMK